MNASEHDAPWSATIRDSVGRVLGTGVLIDSTRVLTCAHVVADCEADTLSVVFPGAVRPTAERFMPRAEVASVIRGDDPSRAFGAAAESADCALLVLGRVNGPLPSAPLLSRLEPSELQDAEWWAFGYPVEDVRELGGRARGTVHSALLNGWVGLTITAGNLITRGFSGSGVWSPTHNSVIGLVGHANPSEKSAQAITIAEINRMLPEAGLNDLDPPPSSLADEADPDWRLFPEEDREFARHWSPRARGVIRESQDGNRFRGRRTALNEINAWLCQPLDVRRPPLVVTGKPGVGKSAVLARVAMTSDPHVAARLPADDGVRAPLGSVNCAVHARGKTALDIAREICRAASAGIPDDLDAFPRLLKPRLAVLSQVEAKPFSVVIDALDEVFDGEQEAVLGRLVQVICHDCASAGIRVLMGVRNDGRPAGVLAELVSRVHPEVIDLDNPAYFEPEDLSGYVLATLQSAEDTRADNPYRDLAAARPLTDRITEISAGNFLIAGLLAHQHSVTDRFAADPDELGFQQSPELSDVFREYLDAVPTYDAGLSATDLLTALAFAESPGFTLAQWKCAIQALHPGCTMQTDLREFARSRAADYLLTDSTADSEHRTYQLFHQALVDVLLQRRARTEETPRPEDEHALATALMEEGRKSGWAQASRYLLSSLPAHAERGGLIDELLIDEYYALYADLRRLIPAGQRSARTARGRDRARLLRLAPTAILDTADPAERAAILDLIRAQEQHQQTSHAGATDLPVPYRAKWARTRPERALAVLSGHSGGIRDVCTIPAADGTSQLATASQDGTVRIWSLETGEQLSTLARHSGPTSSLCALRAGKRSLLAAAGHDEVVRVWNPATGELVHALEGHARAVRAICTIVDPAGKDLLVTTDYDDVIRIWNAHDGKLTMAMVGTSHTTGITAMCPLVSRNSPMLVTASRDSTVHIWDPFTGEHQRALIGHSGPVDAVCVIGSAQDVPLLATAGSDETIRIWNTQSGQQLRTITSSTHTRGLNDLSALPGPDGSEVLVTVSDDRTIQLWRALTGEHLGSLTGHSDRVHALCTVHVPDAPMLLATASRDRTVRIWNPYGVQAADTSVHADPAEAMCELFAPDGPPYLVTAVKDGSVHAWDVHRGEYLHAVSGNADEVYALCSLSSSERFTSMLVSANRDDSIQIWNPSNGETVRTHIITDARVASVCSVTAPDESTMIASADHAGKIRVWSPYGKPRHPQIMQEAGPVTALCSVERPAGAPLIAGVGQDENARIWDPRTGRLVFRLVGHSDRVTSICTLPAPDSLALATASLDRTIRIWHGRDFSKAFTIHIRYEAKSIAWAGESLVISSVDGIMAIDLGESIWTQ